MQPISPLSPSATAIPLVSGFHPLVAPPGVHRWLLPVPVSAIRSHHHSVLDFLGDAKDKDLNSVTRSTYSVISTDMNKVGIRFV